jgi:LysM repeat protein
VTDIVARYVAKVDADTSGLMAGLEKMRSGFGGFSQNIQQIGATMTATITGPLLAFAGLAVKSFSDSENAAAQLNAVLKSTNGIAGVTAKQATDLASSLQKVTRFSDETILGAENIGLTFTGIGKEIFPDVTKAALDMATAMHMDLNSAMLSIGKAVNVPEEGMAKLQRQGVMFTQSQKDMVKQLVASGHTLEAQKIILAELKKEFGGSAEAAGNTFAGALDKLKNKFTDLLEVIGSKIAPALSKGVDFLSGLIDKISALPAPVIQAGVAFGALLAAAGPVLTVVGTLGTVIAALASPIGLVAVGVGALAVAFTTNFLGIRDAVLPAITSIKNAFGSLFSTTQDYKVKKGDTLGGIAKQFDTTVADLMKANPGVKDKNVIHVGQVLDVPDNRGFGNKLIAGIQQVFGDLKDWISTKAWPLIKGAFEAWFDKVKVWISDGGATRIVKGIGDAVIAAYEWVRDHGWDTLKKGFESLVQSVGDFLGGKNGLDFVGKIGQAVMDAANWIGGEGAKRMADAFGKIATAITQVISGIANGIIAEVNKAIAALQGKNGQYVQAYPMNPLPPAFRGITTDTSYTPTTGGMHLPTTHVSGAGRDSGGMGEPNTPYLIGRGAQPETFVPRSYGNFYPAGALGGGPSTIHVVLQADDFVDHILISLADEMDRRRKAR